MARCMNGENIRAGRFFAPKRWILLSTPVWLGAGLAAFWSLKQPQARAEDSADPLAQARCRNMTATALTSRAPLPSELELSDEEYLNALMSSDEFRDHFSSFLMRKLNNTPADERDQDALYTMSVDMLKKGRPLSDLFKGKLTVKRSPATGADYVADDPNGLGYFHATGWMVRYAGNEPSGIRLTTAYRVLHNLTGLKLTAINNDDVEDTSKKGREAAACRGCHYDSWAPLDPIASLFGRKRGVGASMEFLPPEAGVSATIAGHVVHSDVELVELLVASNDYSVRMCKLMFEFAYGREETECEAAAFDRCMATLKATDSAPATLRTIVGEGGFCR